MFKKVLYKIFGTRNDRLLKKYNKVVNKINQLEPGIEKLTDDELKAKTIEFRERIKQGETLDQLLPEAFAVCREASKRVLKMRHFDVQLIGGMVLHDGKISEMRTGEGKTLVATLAAYLNALEQKGVFVVTVNDYLANRDAKEMGKLYNFLGLSVGVNLPDMDQADKRTAYNSDITYGTNNEFGFDYLRDNMVYQTQDKVARSLNFAIVDEVDSILIDEARTPLIISGPSEGSEELYLRLDQVPPLLKAQELETSTDGDFWVDEKNSNVVLSDKGHERVEQILIDMGLLKTGNSLYDAQNISLMHHLLAALKAHYVYLKDQHYVVQDGEVIIVDEFTGRLMSGRRWSDGLHQAVEAKEKVKIQEENQTLASITFQNYFRMFKKLSGMTGTADTEAFEFQQIYGLEVVIIPTNRPMIRKDCNDKIYMTMEDKYLAVVEEIKERNAKGQPVLVGTTSVENSELLSTLLTKAKLKHEVLNAKQHAREADIVAQAGSVGAITVATNMAGRGTDIILGGSPKLAIAKIEEDVNLSELQKQEQIEKILEAWRIQNHQVLELGGLYIIGTERHESRRIDNQLRGRSGRQGDPGETRFYLSLEDQLLRIFGGERMQGMMARLGMDKGESIEHKWLSRSIESAQRKVEGHNFDIRKQLLDYDNVSNDQRKVIYEQRDEVLAATDLSSFATAMIESVMGAAFDNFVPPGSIDEMWEIDQLDKVLQNEFLINYSLKNRFAQNPDESEITFRDEVIQLALATYQNKIHEFITKVKQDIDNFIKSVVTQDKANWDLNQLDIFCMQNGIVTKQLFTQYFKDHPEISREQLLEYINQEIGDVGLIQRLRFERGILIQYLDYYWREHLTSLEHLRQGIHLRGYAQKDPKQEYKQESFVLFSQMLDELKASVAKVLLTVRFQGINDIPVDVEEDDVTNSPLQKLNVTPNSPTRHKIGRNEPCPCGSGKKYKHCCGRL